MPRWQRTPSATRVHRSSAASTGAYSERRRFVTSPSSGRNGGMSSPTLVRFSPSSRPLHHRSVLTRVVGNLDSDQGTEQEPAESAQGEPLVLSHRKVVVHPVADVACRKETAGAHLA